MSLRFNQSDKRGARGPIWNHQVNQYGNSYTNKGFGQRCIYPYIPLTVNWVLGMWVNVTFYAVASPQTAGGVSVLALKLDSSTRRM